MELQMNRREALKAAGAAALGAAAAGALSGCAAGSPGAGEPAPAPARRRRVWRIAHLTDIHIQPERRAAEGLAACLRHAQSLADPPEAVFNGGDCVMDTLATGEERARVQWDLLRRTLREECSLPLIHCLGNHDIWGWNRKKSGLTGGEPGYGKRRALDALELESPYYYQDRENWRVIVLDSSAPDEERVYLARLDEEQFAWLERVLAATDPRTHILILSHIPILSACAYFDGDNESTGDWVVPGKWVHLDARRLKDLFLRHRNVRACLSGHIHLLDRVEYNGVTYLCNGAVCGDWWKGPYQETPEGYALVNLYGDGSFDCEYTPFGWRAEPA